MPESTSVITRAWKRLGWLLLSVSSVFSFEIYHTPPAYFFQGVPSQLEVVLPHYLNDPEFVKLFLRSQGQQSYKELNFVAEQGAWYCDIPASYMLGDTLEYYIGASFGPAGLAAFPAKNPSERPVGVPLIKFLTKNRKFEPKFFRESIADHQVTPWTPRPDRRDNNFPVLYIPKANKAFTEAGFIKIIGNEKATSEELLQSMLYLCLQQNADAITALNFSLLSAKESLDEVKGHIELEGIYLRRAPRK